MIKTQNFATALKNPAYNIYLCIHCLTVKMLIVENAYPMEKPKFKGSALFFRNNYHIGDYNLFYLDVRENAVKRAKTWIEKAGEIR